MNPTKQDLIDLTIAFMEKYEITIMDLEDSIKRNVMRDMLEPDPDEAAWLATQKLGAAGRNGKK